MKKSFYDFDHQGNPYIYHHCLNEKKGQVNWLAMVWFGKERVAKRFLQRNKLGTSFLIPPYLKVGDTLEFAGDRLTAKYRYKYREYFIVEERTETCLVLGRKKVVKTRVNLEELFSPPDK